jgi:uncharacterized protein (TIRG00374 family)
MKKLNTILLFAGLAFLAWLVWRTGPRQLLHEIGILGWGIIPIILIEGAANLAHTIGWRHLIGRGAREIPWSRLFRMAMAGYAINYLTPTASVGGEVSRAALLTAANQNGATAVRSVLLDKLTTAMAHLALAVLGFLLLLIWNVKLPFQLWTAMAGMTVLLAGALGVFLWLQKQGKLGGFFRWLAKHNIGGRALRETAQRASEVDASLREFYREHPRDFALSIGWHFLGHSAAILQAWFFLLLLHQPAPLLTVAGAGLLSLWFDLLTFAIPLNLGTLEGSRVMVFKALGCATLLGMTYGVAIRMAQVFWACFGLASYAMFNAQKRASASPALGATLREHSPGRLNEYPVAASNGQPRKTQTRHVLAARQQ